MVIEWGHVVTGHVGGTAGVDVREVRRFVREALDTEGGAFDLDDIDLMTAEIATNAARHSASGRKDGGVRVTVLWTPDLARVEIQDDGDSETLPQMSHSDEWGESGRGLLLVNELAHAWGVRGGDDERRRGTVWFEAKG